MTEGFHHFSDLFDQLGLASDSASIVAFITRHRPLPADLALADAPFWNAAQADFLRQQLAADADWAEKVDALNLALHQPPAG
ncbi:hypothetical protein CCO03_03530 [Comamonas serinivorans]|uniref:DUF2789 domain-containing protein n=1 Tax=Comamonas serinivorans TaxID=1082851 RepID=A0A1Y0EJP9_9BURK|nr:DUF2789 domain-containing protein [Comamonas serinivorans]ARU03874.1 hypothetical protein CCO03_03530 [Comamonas serinivorans]